MMAGDRKPSLMAILADVLVGVGSKLLMARAVPGADVWQDWISWEEAPIQVDESTNNEIGSISSILCHRFRKFHLISQ